MSEVVLLDPDPARKKRKRAKAKTEKPRRRRASLRRAKIVKHPAIVLDPEPQRLARARRAARKILGIFKRRNFTKGFVIGAVSSYVLNKIWEWAKLPGYGQVLIPGIFKTGIGVDDAITTAAGALVGGVMSKNYGASTLGAVTALTLDKWVEGGFSFAAPAKTVASVQTAAPSYSYGAVI